MPKVNFKHLKPKLRDAVKGNAESVPLKVSTEEEDSIRKEFAGMFDTDEDNSQPASESEDEYLPDTTESDGEESASISQEASTLLEDSKGKLKVVTKEMEEEKERKKKERAARAAQNRKPKRTLNNYKPEEGTSAVKFKGLAKKDEKIRQVYENKRLRRNEAKSAARVMREGGLTKEANLVIEEKRRLSIEKLKLEKEKENLEYATKEVARLKGKYADLETENGDINYDDYVDQGYLEGKMDYSPFGGNLTSNLNAKNSDSKTLQSIAEGGFESTKSTTLAKNNKEKTLAEQTRQDIIDVDVTSVPVLKPDDRPLTVREKNTISPEKASEIIGEYEKKSNKTRSKNLSEYFANKYSRELGVPATTDENNPLPVDIDRIDLSKDMVPAQTDNLSDASADVVNLAQDFVRHLREKNIEITTADPDFERDPDYGRDGLLDGDGGINYMLDEGNYRSDYEGIKDLDEQEFQKYLTEPTAEKNKKMRQLLTKEDEMQIVTFKQLMTSGGLGKYYFANTHKNMAIIKDMFDKWISAAEVCASLEISRRLFYYLVYNNQIDAKKIRGNWYISLAEYYRLLGNFKQKANWTEEEKRIINLADMQGDTGIENFRYVVREVLKEEFEILKEENNLKPKSEAYLKRNNVGGYYPTSKEKYNAENHVIVYVRVASAKDSYNLDRQTDEVLRYCDEKRYHVQKVIKEIGSAYSDDRPKLLNALSEGNYGKIIVDRYESLTKAGINFLRVLLHRIGIEIEAVHENSRAPVDERVRDFVRVLTDCCYNLWGAREYKKKVRNILSTITGKYYEDSTRLQKLDEAEQNLGHLDISAFLSELDDMHINPTIDRRFLDEFDG